MSVPLSCLACGNVFSNTWRSLSVHVQVLFLLGALDTFPVEQLSHDLEWVQTDSQMTLDIDAGASEASAGPQAPSSQTASSYGCFGVPVNQNFTCSLPQYKLFYFSVFLFSCCLRPNTLATQSLSWVW